MRIFVTMWIISEKMINKLLLYFCFIIISAACRKSEILNKENTILIGIAEVNYTPEVGLDLVGNYRGHDYASRGIHDSLFARAIVAKGEDGTKAAVLSVDICYFGRQTVGMMRSYIASKTNIRPENIMIHATHTHSGPKSDLSAPKAKEYLIRAADAAIIADGNLKPSKITAGRSEEERVSFNRRLKCIDGTTHMCWETFEPGFVIGPLGPIDPELKTISIIQDNKTAGVLINFGCHATTLTGNNWLYSADYPGYIAESVKRIHGNAIIPIFLNGPCGNVTQVDYKVGFPDTYEECQRIGYILGVTAMESMNKDEKVDGSVVCVSREMVPLKRIAITKEQYEWAKVIMRKVELEGMPPAQADGIPDAEYAKVWLEMYKTQEQVDSLEVMVILIGGVAFVGLPGEVFCEFGMEIKKASPFKNTLVMGLTNDNRDYFPTKISFTQGPEGFTPMITGYETTPGSTLYEPVSGEKLAESAIRQLKKLNK